MPKILFHQKTHGSRIRDVVEAFGTHNPCRVGGPGPAPRGAATLGTPSGSLRAYKLPLDLKSEGV